MTTIVSSKQAVCASFLGLAILSLSHPGLALTVEEVPNPRQANGGWVTDMANILSPATEAKLNLQIAQLEAKNGTEIAVVTVPTVAPAATSKAFATQLFNHWEIGKAGVDNGVLFLISKGDRRIEIETGYGIEPVLPNAQVSQIIQEQIVPPSKRDDFDAGTLAGTKALVAALETKTFTASIQPVSSTPLVNATDNLQPSMPIGTRILLGLLIIGGVPALLTLVILWFSGNDDSNNGGGGNRGNRRYWNHSPGSNIGSASSSGSTGGSSGGVSGSFGGSVSGNHSPGSNIGSASSSGSTGGSFGGGVSGGSGGGSFGGGSSGGGGAGGGC